MKVGFAVKYIGYEGEVIQGVEQPKRRIESQESVPTETASRG